MTLCPCNRGRLLDRREHGTSLAPLRTLRNLRPFPCVPAGVNAPIALAGDLDADTIRHHRSAIYEAVEADPAQTLTVDLRGVTFIDSTGLGMLVGALKKARLGQGDLVFIRPPAHLWRVFTITGLDKALPFEPDPQP
jgi:anti-sigma B factor antagonist